MRDRMSAGTPLSIAGEEWRIRLPGHPPSATLRGPFFAPHAGVQRGQPNALAIDHPAAAGRRNAHDDQHLDHDDRGDGVRVGWLRHCAAHRRPKGVREEQ